MVMEPDRWESMIFSPTHDLQSDVNPADVPMPVLWCELNHFTPAKELATARQLAGDSDFWIAPLACKPTPNEHAHFQAG
eukprot:6433036-Amphidinium_carterae.1